MNMTISNQNLIPLTDGLAEKVIAFMRRLPEEELSVEDIALKFDAPKALIHAHLKMSVISNMLMRDGQIYSAGSSIGKAEPSIKHSASPFATSPIKRKAPQLPRVAMPDLATIKLDNDVPIPGRGSRGANWPMLLDRLKVNQSTILPRQGFASLSKVITARHNAINGKFVVRKISEEQIRVWRTA